MEAGSDRYGTGAGSCPKDAADRGIRADDRVFREAAVGVGDLRLGRDLQTFLREDLTGLIGRLAAHIRRSGSVLEQLPDLSRPEHCCVDVVQRPALA